MSAPQDYLKELGLSGDGPHDIAYAALMLSALDYSRKTLAPYLRHLDDIRSCARNEARGRLADTVRALGELMGGRLGYDGDRLSYDDPKNADLISVIDRRRGMPVALGILYIHAARAAGIAATGTSSPGHFLVLVSEGSDDGLIDPFNSATLLARGGRGMPPFAVPASGKELVPSEPVSDTDVLLRLENNIKIRALEKADRGRAIQIAERMALIAPSRAELWLDLAHLHELNEELGAAREAYGACLAIAKAGEPLHNEAALALATLRRRLN
jgi:regulator of sirC expression with transglutaminase-like and TPR domain